ncbi:hypothetical protein CERZMDRAFT_89309 [Cercospora zeae-maydis SCOH1-5]|uniref:Apple domain-containing protein n=1 Tax=Cercospora zeae-maydis SCOH1-5 TaxID=717836 RepID=A0A6A6EYD7_9PEZI|nr:hypothetical protein CERZMDRAFT_89309 [Cercospora zeae-maydis SCOH1-5]
MRFSAVLSSLAGLALANPMPELQARQLNPSQFSTCSASYTRSCATGTSMSAAQTWCASLGYGTTISTVRTTATVRRTIVYTISSTTRTSTVTAARVTSTATSVRTTMTTRTTTTTRSTTLTDVETINTFAVIDSCPSHVPANTNPNPEVPGVEDLTSTVTTETTTTTERIAQSTTTAPSTITMRTTTTPAITTTTTTSLAITTTTTTSPRGLGCPNPTPTSFTRAGVVRYYEMCLGFMEPGSSNIRPENEAGCEAACIGKCVAFNYGGDDNNCRTMTSVTGIRTIGAWKAYSLVSKSTLSSKATTTSTAINTIPTTCVLATAAAPTPAKCNTQGRLFSANDGTGPLKQKYIENLPNIEACAAACRKFDASGDIGESGMPGCKSLWYFGDRSCELQRKDLNASYFEPGGFGFGAAADMDCFSCGAVGAASISITSTGASTTRSSTTTTSPPHSSTTIRTTTAPPTMTTSPGPSPLSTSSGCVLAPAQATAVTCGDVRGNPRNTANPEGSFLQRVLTNLSPYGPEECAEECRVFDQSGVIGDSGRPGCKAILWQEDSCQLWRVDVRTLTVQSGVGPIAYDMACFECSNVGTATRPPPARVTEGRYHSCQDSHGQVLEYEGGVHYQLFCGIISSPEILSTWTKYSIEDCAAECTNHPLCSAVTWHESGIYANRCELKYPPGSDTGTAYTLEPSDPPPGTVLVSAGRVKVYNSETWPPRVDTFRASKRHAGLLPRQGRLPQPNCLKATSDPQITAACNCVIPRSSVTLTQTVSSIVTIARSITTTQNIFATTTMTPTITITTTRVTTLFRTRAVTAWSTFHETKTETSVTSYQLAATPSAFYIVDQNMAFAEWPADADEIHYHIQYDWDQSDDEYAPTVFSLANDQLQVADLSNVEGLAEGYPVVGQSYDGPGMQLMALSNGGGMESPTCKIEPTKEGQCPIVCRMGENEVNVRNADGLWSLVPKDGGEEGFTNYALAADVAVERGDGEADTDEPGEFGGPSMPA